MKVVRPSTVKKTKTAALSKMEVSKIAKAVAKKKVAEVLKKEPETQPTAVVDEDGKPTGDVVQVPKPQPTKSDSKSASKPSKSDDKSADAAKKEIDELVRKTKADFNNQINEKAKAVKAAIDAAAKSGAPASTTSTPAATAAQLNASPVTHTAQVIQVQPEAAAQTTSEAYAQPPVYDPYAQQYA